MVNTEKFKSMISFFIIRSSISLTEVRLQIINFMEINLVVFVQEVNVMKSKRFHLKVSQLSIFAIKCSF
jgi:hypothetical protein